MTKEWLLNNGFKYSRPLSNDDASVYTYRFPVFKYKKMIVLECELGVILEENDISINVYDYGTNDKYASFYYCEYGNYDRILKNIWDKIERMLDKLQIEREVNNE